MLILPRYFPEWSCPQLLRHRTLCFLVSGLSNAPAGALRPSRGWPGPRPAAGLPFCGTALASTAVFQRLPEGMRDFFW